MRLNLALAESEEELDESSSKPNRERRSITRAPKAKATKLSSVAKVEETKTRLSPRETEELIVAHTEHGERIARSLLNRWRVRMTANDITSAVGLALCEAGQRFDPSKGVSFKTFLFYHLRGMLIKEIIRLVDEHRICQTLPDSSNDGLLLDAQSTSFWPLPVVETQTPESMVQKQQLASICWQACASLDELEREVVIRSFIFDQPLNEIAKDLRYCRCHISRVKSRALALLSKQIRDRLPDYKISILDGYDSDGSTKEGSKLSKSRDKKRYKGGRGRRKSNSFRSVD